MSLKIREIRASSILIKSGLPAADWVINPYNGCLFGCMYCYAAQIAKWKHPDEIWGNYLDVKINAPELLKNELEKLVMRRSHHIYDFRSIFFSSVTDPYVGMEAKYKLTRKCLEVLADFGYQGSISILTKSPLITRDIDLFKKFKDIEVGMTVTGLDDKVSRFLEVKAPPVTSRIKALKELSDAGIILGSQSVLLKGVNDNNKIIKELLYKCIETGVRPYYLYQCDEVLGTEHFWTEYQEMFKIADNLIGNISGLATPSFVFDCKGGQGKVRVIPEFYKSKKEKNHYQQQ